MIEKKKIAIIGASYLQLPLIEKAKMMGLETHVFAWAADDVGEKAADFFYPISIREKEEILKVCEKVCIDGICSIGSDLAMLTVGYIANNMGLTSNSNDAVQKSTNKHLMRLAFEQAGDPSPKSVLIDASSELNDLVLEYPIIVKPTDRSGSRGICKLDNGEGLNEAVTYAIAQSFEKKVLLEEFVDGKEYSVEYISWEGRHYFIAVTEKHTTGAPHFIETGHKQPADLDGDTVEKVKTIINHALTTLGISFGASHSEIKINNDGNIKIIEIGGRMGGDCIGSDLVTLSTGYDYVKAVIDVALGKKPETPSGNSIQTAIIEYEIDEKVTDSSNRLGYKIYTV